MASVWSAKRIRGLRRAEAGSQPADEERPTPAQRASGSEAVRLVWDVAELSCGANPASAWPLLR